MGNNGQPPLVVTVTAEQYGRFFYGVGIVLIPITIISVIFGLFGAIRDDIYYLQNCDLSSTQVDGIRNGIKELGFDPANPFGDDAFEYVSFSFNESELAKLKKMKATVDQHIECFMFTDNGEFRDFSGSHQDNSDLYSAIWSIDNLYGQSR